MYLAEAVSRLRCHMPLQPPANLYARYLAGDLLSPDEATAVSEYLGRMGFPGNGRGPAYGPEDELGANDALDLFDAPGSSPAGPFAGAGMQEQAPAGTPNFVPPASEGAVQEPAGGFGGSPVHLAYGGNPDGVRAMAFYNMPDLRDRARLIADRIRRDSITPKAISDARLILSQKVQEPDGSMRWEIAPKDYYAEIAKIYWATLDPNSPWAVRYMHDHPLVDTFSTYEFMSRVPAGDCFVKGTLVLRDDHALVPVESLRVGDRIWGRDRWSEVTNTWDKGSLPTSLIELNNGGTVRLTRDHKVWIHYCPKHDPSGDGRDRGGCTAAKCKERTAVKRIRVHELQPGMRLVRPDCIPYGTGSMDAGRAYVEGLYLSDGWSGEGTSDECYRFFISGQDGCPKEAQKREVEAICAAAGIATRWHRKYLAVNDSEWAKRLHSMGHRAPQKRLLSVNWDENTSAQLLRGIMADSGAASKGSGRTLTSTSRELIIQARVLLKMRGQTCGLEYVPDHGGLGKNPVWRLNVWGKRADGKAEKALRVKAVHHDDEVYPCFDFETDDHFVWLPESDWTTSQCDEGTIVIGTRLRAAGYPLKLRIIQTSDPGVTSFNHIYLVAGTPPLAPDDWVALDWSTGNPPGWQIDGAADLANRAQDLEPGIHLAQSEQPVGRVVAVLDVDV